MTECEFLTDVLQINGVPKTAIIQENESGSTKENAYFSRKAADYEGILIKKAIICCKSFHARRCLLCYQFAFPDVEFLVHPVTYFEGKIEISAHNWHQTDAGVERVLGEIQRYGNQFKDEFMDLTK